jgi:hypothetical protein
MIPSRKFDQSVNAMQQTFSRKKSGRMKRNDRDPELYLIAFKSKSATARH